MIYTCWCSVCIFQAWWLTAFTWVPFSLTQYRFDNWWLVVKLYFKRILIWMFSFCLFTANNSDPLPTPPYDFPGSNFFPSGLGGGMSCSLFHTLYFRQLYSHWNEILLAVEKQWRARFSVSDTLTPTVHPWFHIIPATRNSHPCLQSSHVWNIHCWCWH